VTAAHKALESEISNGSQIVSLDNRLTDWQAKKIGFITLEFKALRLYPASDATVEMYGSISYYRSRMCELDRVLKGFAKQPESRSKAKTRCDVTVSYANELDLAVTEHTEKGFLDVWSKVGCGITRTSILLTCFRDRLPKHEETASQEISFSSTSLWCL
jgi:hypothetical protein